MLEIIECPFCEAGNFLDNPQCCGVPNADMYGSTECCGYPDYSVRKCQACEGTGKITKQQLMELKLKGFDPCNALYHREIEIQRLIDDI